MTLWRESSAEPEGVTTMVLPVETGLIAAAVEELFPFRLPQLTMAVPGVVVLEIVVACLEAIGDGSWCAAAVEEEAEEEEEEEEEETFDKGLKWPIRPVILDDPTFASTLLNRFFRAGATELLG